MLYGIEAQFIGSLVLFINKIFLYYEKPVGWILGIIGISILTPLVIHFGLTTLIAYHVFLVVLLSYGYFLTTQKSKKFSDTAKLKIKVSIIVFALLSCLYLTFQTLNSDFTFLQLAQSATGLSGALFLAFPSPTSKFLGWFSNMISHICAAYLMFHLPTPATAVAVFQILSIIFAILGMFDHAKTMYSADVPT